MDIPPLILNKLFKIPVSISMYVFDSLIVLAQFGFSDVRQCLYGIVLIFIYTMVIDKILVMGAQKIEVKIISSKYEEIRKAILTKCRSWSNNASWTNRLFIRKYRSFN
mgnify:FL=1